MRGEHMQDWATRDSLAEVTEIYVRPEGSGPTHLPEPPAYVPAPLPNVRMFSVDDRGAMAALAIGSAPRMRVSDITHRVPRRGMPRNVLVGAGVAACVALGITLGLATARGGASLDDVATKPVHVAAPVASSQLTVTPIAAPAPVAPAKPALVTVHIESLPGGAIATLLDNGKPTQLGMTPLDAELDPAKAYDIVVSLDGRTPRVQHVVPAQQQDLVFAFDDDAAKPVVKAVDAPKPVAVAPKHVEAKPAVEVAMGTLKIASKPPCAIAVDGRATGKVTPQAALALAAGSHEITLTNEEQGIQLTTSVEIRADKSTDLVQDFTK